MLTRRLVSAATIGRDGLALFLTIDPALLEPFWRYSHEYPVQHGHDLVRSIPLDLWTRARKRAHGEHRSMRVVVIRALKLYASGRLQP